jgi:hypothetical protein
LRIELDNEVLKAENLVREVITMPEILEERYEVREDGIYLIYVTEDEEIKNLILPKETFIEALAMWGDNND